jgi:hypothetical protein
MNFRNSETQNKKRRGERRQKTFLTFGFIVVSLNVFFLLCGLFLDELLSECVCVERLRESASGAPCVGMANEAEM